MLVVAFTGLITSLFLKINLVTTGLVPKAGTFFTIVVFTITAFFTGSFFSKIIVVINLLEIKILSKIEYLLKDSKIIVPTFFKAL